MRKRSIEFETICPFDQCEERVMVTAYPGTQMRIGRDPDDSDPGSSVEVEVRGCICHHDMILSDDMYETMLALTAEQEENAYSDAIDAGIDRINDDEIDRAEYLRGNG